MKVPTIKTIQNFDEILTVFGNKDEFVKRLNEFKIVEDAINEKLERYEHIKDMNSKEANANNLFNQSKVKLAEAEAILADARKDAVRIVAEANSKADGINAETTVKKNEANALMTRLNQQRTDQKSKEDDLNRKQKEADALLKEAKRKSEEAESLRDSLYEAQKNMVEALKG
jgi:F0F1-type ATP synthase membrane subunit b/b'